MAAVTVRNIDIEGGSRQLCKMSHPAVQRWQEKVGKDSFPWHFMEVCLKAESRRVWKQVTQRCVCLDMSKSALCTTWATSWGKGIRFRRKTGEELFSVNSSRAEKLSLSPSILFKNQSVAAALLEGTIHWSPCFARNSLWQVFAMKLNPFPCSHTSPKTEPDWNREGGGAQN